MKALTIREPWATLIVEGYKKYEFRSWKTNYRGKIYIHVGLSLEKEYVDKFKIYNLKYSKGEIIGEAELVDCILVNEKFNNELKKENSIVYGINNHTSAYAWKLDNSIKYDKKIPCKGKLGLWNYQENNMTHEMRLHDSPFNMIKNGTKTVELRLYDEKRRLINKNDIIEFTNRKTDEVIKTKVINMHKYTTFEELYKYFDKISIGYTEDEEMNPCDMDIYYSKEEQIKYGVVGIEISLIK